MPEDFPILVGAPPADPKTISFDPACFATVGTRTEYVIVFAAPRYPERSFDRSKLEDLSRRTGRPIEERQVPIRRRVSWTLPA